MPLSGIDWYYVFGSQGRREGVGICPRGETLNKQLLQIKSNRVVPGPSTTGDGAFGRET